METGSALNSYISKGANVILDVFRMNTITLGSIEPNLVLLFPLVAVYGKSAEMLEAGIAA